MRHLLTWRILGATCPTAIADYATKNGALVCAVIASEAKQSSSQSGIVSRCLSKSTDQSLLYVRTGADRGGRLRS
jgi:hypothetical protein